MNHKFNLHNRFRFTSYVSFTAPRDIQQFLRGSQCFLWFLGNKRGLLIFWSLYTTKEERNNLHTDTSFPNKNFLIRIQFRGFARNSALHVAMRSLVEMKMNLLCTTHYRQPASHCFSSIHNIQPDAYTVDFDFIHSGAHRETRSEYIIETAAKCIGIPDASLA